MSNVRKAVIPVAGRGTRMYPASSAVAKGMFPLVDRDGLCKPVIHIIAEEAIESGIEEICIVTQPGGEGPYREYFRGLDEGGMKAFRGKQWAMDASEKLRRIGQRLRFSEQRTPEGFGHAVYQARQFVGDEPFLLLLGDHVHVSDIPRRCARQAMDVFEQFDCDAVTSVQVSPESDLPLFAAIASRPVDEAAGVYRAELIIEKPPVEVARQKLQTPGLPAGTYLTHFGQHVFGPGIFHSLERLITDNVRHGGEIQLTAAQEHLRQNCRKYWLVVTRGKRYDTGVPEGLLETQVGLALGGVHRKMVRQAFERLTSDPQGKRI